MDAKDLEHIFADINVEDEGKDPGGETDWIAALAAWAVDEAERYNTDAATLAKKLATIWEVGNLVEKELSPRFQIRATLRPTFPYVGIEGELNGGVVDERRFKPMNEDPRELACAIAAEVVRAAKPEHNVVLFRRLLTKSTLFSAPLQYEYRTSFGLARVA